MRLGMVTASASGVDANGPITYPGPRHEPDLTTGRVTKAVYADLGQ